jgi:NitT/TauT family transport system permease protein
VPSDRRAAPGAIRGAVHRLAGLAVFLAAWFVAAHEFGARLLLPSPLGVAAFAWRETLDGALPRQMGVTLARVGVAFALATILGSAIGYAMGRSARVNAIADPWLVIMLNLPLLVIVLLAYVWVGLNDVAAVLAVVVAKMPSIVVTIREGARALDPALGEMAAVFRLSASRRLGAIVLPQLAPYLAAAVRGGLSITWKIVLVVELLGRPNGVGFALNLYFQNFDVTGILAYGLVFAAIMLLVETILLQPFERRANAWRADA